MTKTKERRPHHKSDYRLKVTPLKDTEKTLEDIIHNEKFVKVIHQLLLKYS